MATIYGTNGPDTLPGTAGDDTIYGWAAGGSESTDSGNDSIVSSVGTPDFHSSDWLYGGGGNDTLQGEAFSCHLFGQAGDDTMAGGILSVLDGGSGNDTIQGIDLATITGGQGDDYILPGPGGDSIDGGEGSDIIDYGVALDAVKVDLGSHRAGPIDAAPNETIVGIEHAFGTAGADSLIGDALSNTLLGYEGSDTLLGMAGDDTLLGAQGADSLSGGEGNDVADYSRADIEAAAVNVSLVTHIGMGGEATGDTLLGIENLVGSNFGDTLAGDGAPNSLDGGLGADSLSGGGASDILAGRAGADSLDGGGGSDTAVYSSEAGTGVGVSLVAGLGNFGEATGDSLVRVENLEGTSVSDVLIGNAPGNVLSGLFGNDSLNGGSGNDSLDGGGGADTLRGGTGQDTMSGGAGDDHFAVVPGANREYVNDFHQESAPSAEHDKLDLTLFHFASAADALSRASTDGTNSYFDLDGNAATHEVTLLGVAHVDASDILI